jgi:hypothetical protein
MTEKPKPRQRKKGLVSNAKPEIQLVKHQTEVGLPYCFLTTSIVTFSRIDCLEQESLGVDTSDILLCHHRVTIPIPR